MNQMLGLIEVDAGAGLSAGLSHAGLNDAGLNDGAWGDNALDRFFGAPAAHVDRLVARCSGGLLLQAGCPIEADLRQMCRQLEGHMAELVNRIAASKAAPK